MRRLVLLLCLLALAAPAAAAAATPRFAVWDLQSDLAPASKNEYGDVAVKPRRQLTGRGTVVRCAGWCRFGSGWLEFKAPPRLAAADVTAAKAGYTKKLGWYVRVTLRPAAATRWAKFMRNVAEGKKIRGVPDVLVVVADGQVASAPFGTAVPSSHGVVTLTGFSRAAAKALEKAA